MENLNKQGLISGKDALIALANGEDVEIKFNNTDGWHSVNKKDAYSFEIFLDPISAQFRLKPRTITLNVEIPAPFEPKVGEVFYVLAPTAVGGYSKMHITDQKRMDDYAKLGAWRTEEENQPGCSSFAWRD